MKSPLEKGARGIEIEALMFTLKNIDFNAQGVLFSILVKIPKDGYNARFSYESNFPLTPV